MVRDGDLAHAIGDERTRQLVLAAGKDAAGEVTELRCIYDPETRGVSAPGGRKVKSTIHWVSAAHAVDAEVRLYDYLFPTADPGGVPEGTDWKTGINPASEEVLTGCKTEAFLAGSAVGGRCQFERIGYFAVDPDSDPGRLVFNRIVTLKDAWAKIEKKQG